MATATQTAFDTNTGGAVTNWIVEAYYAERPVVVKDRAQDRIDVIGVTGLSENKQYAGLYAEEQARNKSLPAKWDTVWAHLDRYEFLDYVMRQDIVDIDDDESFFD